MFVNGNIKIGWFLGNGHTLHGYGKDTNSEEKELLGLFEKGCLRNKDDVELLDFELDFIARPINFSDYTEVIDTGIMNDIDNSVKSLSLKMNEPREKAIS